MLTSSNPSNQYLRPEYLSPLPTTVSSDDDKRKLHSDTDPPTAELSWTDDSLDYRPYHSISLLYTACDVARAWWWSNRGGDSI